MSSDFPTISQTGNTDKQKAEKLRSRGIELREKDKLKEAVQCLSKAIKLDPSSSNYQLRAFTFERMENYENALCDHEQAIKLAPSYYLKADCYRYRALAYRDVKNYKNALSDLNRAKAICDADYYFNCGIIHCETENFKKALRNFNQAIKLEPSMASYYSWRGLAYWGAGNLSATVDDFKTALRLEPGNKDYKKELKMALKHQG